MTRSAPRTARGGVALLLAALAVAACGSDVTGVATADEAPPAASPDDVGRVLEGTWRVQVPGADGSTVLDLRGSELTVFGRCGSFRSAWAARGGLFLAGAPDEQECASGAPESVRWLSDATGYARAGDGWSLLDRTAQTLATLFPGGAVPDGTFVYASTDDSSGPTPAERAAANASPAAALPPGLAPADPADLPGVWEPTHQGGVGCGPTDVQFYADGLWGQEHDEHRAGRWVLGTGGLALGTATPPGVGVTCQYGQSEVESPVNDLDRWMPRVARLGMDGAVLVLLDRTGEELGRLGRRPTPAPAPDPAPKPVDPRRSGHPVAGGGVRYLAATGEHQFGMGPIDEAAANEPIRDDHLILDVDRSDQVMVVYTGCSDGDLWLTVRARTSPPPPLARSMKGWEVGEEETVTIREPLGASSLYGDWSATIFTPKTPGLHRVRLLAKGRNTNYDAVCETPVESYDMTIWPVDTREPRVRLGDDGV